MSHFPCTPKPLFLKDKCLCDSALRENTCEPKEECQRTHKCAKRDPGKNPKMGGVVGVLCPIVTKGEGGSCAITSNIKKILIALPVEDKFA